MASPEVFDEYDRLQGLRHEMINEGVRAAVAWVSTPPAQRTEHPDNDPDFVAATRAYEAARAQFQDPFEFIDG